MGSLFIERPFLALLPAAFFLLLHVGLRRKSVSAHSRLPALTASAWAAYGIYEWLMELRILCTGECNIRVDLLLIYPALLALSLIALIVCLRRLAGPGIRST